MIEFRKTTHEDIPKVMQIVEHARSLFKQTGIPQWQDGYPNAESFAQDIEAGCSYVLCKDGEVCATAAIILTGEPTYAVIYDGEWKQNGDYAAIHRVAVDPAHKKQGLAGTLVENAVRIARENGMAAVRCDTHEVNRPMRGMLEKNGLEYCGRIHLNDAAHSPRVAYELVL